MSRDIMHARVWIVLMPVLAGLLIGALPQAALADGPPLLPAILTLSPASRAFGSVEVGQNPVRTFTVANPGYSTLVGTATVSAPFSIKSGSPFSVPVGTSVTVTVAFSAAQPGSFTSSVVFASNGGGATGVVTGVATGSSLPAQLLVGPAGFDFRTVAAGQTAQALFTLSNAGGVALTGGISVGSADFSLSTNRLDLPGLGSTNLVVTFAPSGSGAFSNDLVFTSNGGNLTAPLLGIGIVMPALLLVTPTNLNFGLVLTGTQAHAVFTVTNAGSLALTGSVALAGGAFALDASDFILPGFGWTNLVVSFNSTQVGFQLGEAVFESNGGNASPPLAGEGTAEPDPWVRLSAASYSGVEGSLVKVKVLRRGRSAGRVSVPYFLKNGRALAGYDFIAKSGTLTWETGDVAPKVLKIYLILNSKSEPDEVFKIKLGTPVGAILGPPSIARITIQGSAEPVSALGATAPKGGGAGDWSTSPLAPWRVEGSGLVAGGRGPAMSGLVGPGQISWLRTELEGPGTLAFDWSLAGHGPDVLLFLDQGIVSRRLEAGSAGSREVLFLGAGRHVVQWALVAGSAAEAGAALLDQVEWLPESP